MFFHIDESGNTGNNLFDPNQPTLSYGVLSSKLNVDVLGCELYEQILKELGVNVIHASILGVDRLTRIAPILKKIQNNFLFNFDYYFIDKKSFALIIFFDAVFDAGLNDAVKWEIYWSPVRFLFIKKLSLIFDEELMKESWSLCLDKNINTIPDRIVALLTELLKRTRESSLDDRSKELISDAFRFGIKYPLKLDFGVTDDKIISPNSVCFQFVISAMAERLNKNARKNALSIVVDRQSEFNPAQITTHYNAARLAEGLKKIRGNERKMYLFHPLHRFYSEDVILRKGTPTRDLTILNSKDSIGLQIVDSYLWIVNRHMFGRELSPELTRLAQTFVPKSMMDGISMEGMVNRFVEFEKILPKLESLTDDQLRLAEENIRQHRAKVRGLNE